MITQQWIDKQIKIHAENIVNAIENREINPVDDIKYQNDQLLTILNNQASINTLIKIYFQNIQEVKNENNTPD